MILQCNPKAGYFAHKKEIDEAVSKVLNSGWYILGDECLAFENEFSKFNQTDFALGVASGTDALELALRALGVVAGDQVITVSHTAVATVSAISRVGAEPVFVDILDDYTLDPEQLEVILRKTKAKAVIVVHLYGQPADMDLIMPIARQFNVPVIEDCAQAHGALFNGKKVGSFGIAGCFSFYPTKNLGAIGDGGMLVTSNKDVYEAAKVIRQYGWKERYISEVQGINSRLDELQAAILRIKLKYLEQSNLQRQKIARFYFDNLSDTHLFLPAKKSVSEHVFHQFVVRTENRDFLKSVLSEKKIGTAVHYPKPVHQQPAYKNPKFCPLPLVNTEGLCSQILSLPMYPELSDNEVAVVCDAVNSTMS